MLQDKVDLLSCVYVEHLLPARSDPFCGGADEAVDKALEAAGDVKTLDGRAYNL